MAIDKAIDSAQLDGDLASVANAIRRKGGTSAQLSFPSGMVSAVEDIQTGIEPERLTWQQTPEKVQEYLDYVAAHPYDPDDYSYSFIQNFAPSQSVEANERPIGQAVATDAGTLEIGGYKKTVAAGSNTIYNAVPKVETLYALVSSSGDVKQTGTLKPTKPLRQIKAMARNIRDLGGWACDGGYIKYGKLFRGGEVSNSADLDIFLNQLGIRAELDLQGADGGSVHVLSDAVDYCCPGNGDSWALYTIANKEPMKEAIRFIFDSIKANKPLYFHCTYGADRTGTIACIIESLLGVSRSEIDVDWELSTFYTGTGGTDMHFARIRNTNVGHYATLWNNLQTEIEALTGTTRQEKIANYIASLGFTAQEINDFRTSMIDGTPATLTPSIGTVTVANNLTHAASDNPATGATRYQPYESNITPGAGYVISSVQIIMGGADITEQVWRGEKTNLYRAVTKTLAHCSIDNTNNAVIDGQSFAAEITVAEGYTLDGATVSITVGGVDITNQVWVTKEDKT